MYQLNISKYIKYIKYINKYIKHHEFQNSENVELVVQPYFLISSKTGLGPKKKRPISPNS